MEEFEIIKHQRGSTITYRHQITQGFVSESRFYYYLTISGYKGQYWLASIERTETFSRSDNDTSRYIHLNLDKVKYLEPYIAMIANYEFAHEVIEELHKDWEKMERLSTYEIRHHLKIIIKILNKKRYAVR